MKTRSVKPNEVVEKWFLVDATGVRLGRLATKIASLLNGKDDVERVDYHQHKNKVIVINSKAVDIHPRKREQKIYYRHSGYVGGLAEISYKRMSEKHPNRIIELAVKGMLPKTRQQSVLFNNMFVYEEAEHKHDAQKPIQVEVK